MPTSYRFLTADYHLLFPARAPQLRFLARLAGQPPARIVDVASGTGEYTAALARQGYDCLGLELDLSMHEQALARHPELKAQRRLIHGDMLELMELIRGPAALAFCLGNSLPHLANLSQVAAALYDMWQQTRPAGLVAVQVVNFERVLTAGAGRFELPTLKVKRADGTEVALARHYRSEAAQRDKRGKLEPPMAVEFHLALHSGGEAVRRMMPLLTLTRARLETCLPAGAKTSWYGNFDEMPWSETTPATVLVLR